MIYMKKVLYRYDNIIIKQCKYLIKAIINNNKRSSNINTNNTQQINK